MNKAFATDDHSQLIEAAGGRAFQFFDRSDRLTKSASDVISRKDIQANMPPDSHFGVHLITMGMEEAFGPNRNGDSFSKESVGKYHGTFEKFGTVFREHKNRCPRTQGIGIVKLAKVNDRMSRGELIAWVSKDKAPDMYKEAQEGKELSFSMSCFPAGTPVMRPDGTSVDIDKVSCGDEVLTHKGNAGKVSHVSERDYTGLMVKVRAWGLPHHLVCTGDHPVWTRPALRKDDPCPVCGKKFKSLSAHLWQKKDAQHQKARRDYSRHMEAFWPAHRLWNGDYLRTAIPTRNNNKGSKAQAVVAGYYLAEGSLTTVRKRNRRANGDLASYKCFRVEWTFGSGEHRMAKELADNVEELGYTRPGIFPEPKYSRIRVSSSSRELHDWLLQHCGKYSYGKRISSELMGWAVELQLILLSKWLNGDGHWCATNEIVGGTTVSEDLAMQMVLLAARAGMAATLSSCQPRIRPILGNPLVKNASRRRAYQLKIHSLSDIEKLRGLFCKIPKKIPSKKQTWERTIGQLRHQEEGKVVTQKKKADDKMCVFVEGGHIYRRVKSVEVAHVSTQVYDLTVPGDHGFQAGGVGVSNCRLPHDECSCCGKKSRRVTDYCSHLRNHMLDYLPEFKKYAYARNEEDVKFFDISQVKRRADRIAAALGYSFADDAMRKAASEGGDPVITGAQWAQFYDGEVVPFSPWEQQTLEKLAEEAEFVRRADPATRSVLLSMAPRELSKEASDVLASGDFRSVGGELTNRAMLIDFATFASIVTGERVEDLRKQASFCQVEDGQLPTLLEDMLRAGGCRLAEDVLSAVEPNEEGCRFSPEKDEVDRLLSTAVNDLGVRQEDTKGRTVRITMMKVAAVREAPEKATEFDPYYSAMAQAYGSYLVKAAHRLKDHPGVSGKSFFRLVAGSLILKDPKRLPCLNCSGTIPASTR